MTRRRRDSEYDVCPKCGRPKRTHSAQCAACRWAQTSVARGFARGFDACPNCGLPKRKKSKSCADCHGYGRKRHLMPSGYVRVWAPGHPMAQADGYAAEHRWLLYEMAIPVPPDHQVHHRNGDKADNRWSNLEVVETSEHHRRHVQEAGWVVNQYGTWPLRRNRP